MNVRLIDAPNSTLRTWVLLANMALANGSPIVASIAKIAEVSRQVKPISVRGVSRGLRDLVDLGMATVERRGNVSVIKLAGVDDV